MWICRGPSWRRWARRTREDIFAGADGEDGFVVEAVEDALGEIDGDGGDGGRGRRRDRFDHARLWRRRRRVEERA